MNPYHFFFAGMFATAAVAWAPLESGKLWILGAMLFITAAVTLAVIGIYTKIDNDNDHE